MSPLSPSNLHLKIESHLLENFVRGSIPQQTGRGRDGFTLCYYNEFPVSKQPPYT